MMYRSSFLLSFATTEWPSVIPIILSPLLSFVPVESTKLLQNTAESNSKKSKLPSQLETTGYGFDARVPVPAIELTGVVLNTILPEPVNLNVPIFVTQFRVSSWPYEMFQNIKDTSKSVDLFVIAITI
jgi:hypothetical protein